MIRFKLKHCVVLLVCLLAFGSTRVLAQGASGAIEGQVFDAQQLPVPGVTVSILNAQGNTITSVINLNDGGYRVERLPDGMYIVEFSRDGFATFRKTGVAIAGGQTVTVDAVLQPQAVSSNVTVTAQVQDENVASKTDIPPSALPVTTETVSRDLIDQTAALDIVSVLNNLPATYAYTDYGSLDYWEFRGLMQDNNYNSARLLNDIPILGNVSDSQINSVQEIDVLKGPASMRGSPTGGRGWNTA